MAVRSIGRYEVLQLLGSGGFATVYLARDDRLDTNVAVKVLAENWSHDVDFTRRFIEEARLLRRCDDDRVVRVHTIEQLDDGRPYFVMDYADRGTLADRVFARLDEGRPFGLQEALALSRELADCLTVVHDCGIVHRDLKPSNVLFRSVRPGTGWGGSDERMMLGDFGLARNLVLASGRTISAGTPAYVSPEQADPAKAGSVDERADVYSAAVILYELLAGEPPFDHANLDQAAARATSPQIRQVRPEVPPSLSELIRAGLATDPAERPSTAAAWLAAIDVVRSVVPPDPPAGSPPGTGMAPPPPPTGVAPPPPPPAAVAPAPGAPAPGATAGGAPVRSWGPSESSAWSPPPVPPSPTPVWPPPLPDRPAVPGPVSGTELAPPSPARPRRKSPWALLAGIVAALVLVVVVALALGRSKKPSGSAIVLAPTTTAPKAASPATTFRPPATTRPPGAAAGTPAGATPAGATPASTPPASTAVTSPTTAPPDTVAADVSILGRWFAAVTPGSCQPSGSAESLRGVDEAASCVYPNIFAEFTEVGTVREGPDYIAVLARDHPEAVLTTWSAGTVGGEEISYRTDRGPALTWTYTGQRYLATAVGASAAGVTSWWASFGRTLAPGAA